MNMEQTKNVPDYIAVRQLKNGDWNGLEILVPRYQEQSLRVAYLITQDRQLAEDVTQEVFIRIANNIRKFDETRPFEPYLMRCVVNFALDAVRKENRMELSPDGLEKLEQLIQDSGGVEDSAVIRQVRQEVAAAMQRLSPRQRSVVVMRYYLGLSEKEMADNLGDAPGTIKWLLNAARTRLRSLLDGERNMK